ncbi:MAG: dihydrodipicolinate synthase family protein [Deltaproteobacteria bacterium]|nr:dihydrodipicolinate synthase family protein [Deltaproteobacteria bacterium]
MPSDSMVSNTNKLPKGLICPLVTPLKMGDVLDLAALERLIAHVGTAADAILIGDAIWGEGLALSAETRLKLTCATLEIAQGKWPIFITITSDTPEATRALLANSESFLERLGYPGIVFWVDYPIYYHSNRGLPQFYAAMARDTQIPLILGNHPELTRKPGRRIKHKNIRTSVLKKLSKIDRIQGLVFTGSLKRSINYHKAVRRRPGFVFYDGDEAAFIRQPSSDGVVAGGSNLLPGTWREIAESCLNRYEVQQQYPDHVSQIWEKGAMVQEFYNLYAANPAAVMKRMLHVAGLLPNAQTASSTPLTDKSQNESIEAICGKYDLI